MENFSLSSQGVSQQATDAMLALLRIFWRERAEGIKPGEFFPAGDASEISKKLAKECPEVLPELRQKVITEWLAERTRHGSSPVSFNALSKRVLPQVCPEDARYMAMRSIRRRHGLKLSSATAAAAHHLTRAVAQLLEQSPERRVCYEDLNAAVKNRLRPEGISQKADAGLRKAFINLAFVLNLFELSDDGKSVTLQPESTDAEYMMSHLFGIPTAIPGFDALFGGGGLMLADSVHAASGDDDKEGIGGRSVLCIGPFGSGKTLLTLQFAVDVARKGGVAWVMALEQTSEECLYALESIGVSTTNPAFTVAGSLSESFRALSHPAPTRGALVFLRPGEDEIDYTKFVDTVEKRLSWMSSYPLRLLIVDPINALIPNAPDQPEVHTIRAVTQKMFEAAKRAHVNVWFTSEQVSKERGHNHFEENIADTVIHLDFDRARAQPKRYLEVTKSRFQQESAGRHSMVIESRAGMHIYPSSAGIAQSSAIAARLMSSRRQQPGIPPIHFGVPGIEGLLGSEPMRPGDIVVLAGPGKAKTLVGVQFLLTDLCPQEECCSVFVSDYTPNQIDRLIETIAGSNARNLGRNVERCYLPTGYVDPGRILLEIQTALDHCQHKGSGVRRVLLTNLARWEQEMPLILEDQAFGIGLVALLRSYNAVALAVCGDSVERSSRFRETMFDQADIFLKFLNIGVQGRTTTLITAVKTRFMQHQREAFELTLDRSGLSVRPAPLFRITPSGDATPIKISLFLHAETENHRRHNERMIEGLRAIISPHAEIAEQSRRFDPSLLSMSQYSAVDELQVFQLDEFQLPTIPAAAFGPNDLCSFDAKVNAGLLKGRLPEFSGERISCANGRRFLAVPFYANLSFFAVHMQKFEYLREDLDCMQFPQSWLDLATLCNNWENKHPDSDELLFSCSIYREGIETYNCLFFEMLYNLSPPGTDSPIDLSLWLSPSNATEAGFLFWVLCRRSHALGYLRKKALPWVISRHWYNTLNQELWDMTPEKRAQICVKPLIGGFTTAGEWYLSIPSHSASPEIGLRLIEQLTTAARETQRVELGVGLPTRTAYYVAPDTSDASVSRYFSLSRADVYRLLKGAIRRSNFQYYQRLANTIASHLQWLLEIPEPAKGNSSSIDEVRDAVWPQIEGTMKGLASNLRFLSQSEPAACAEPRDWTHSNVQVG
jgi:KaiC/GvpD/RAD55 family RecA-like ATPase